MMTTGASERSDVDGAISGVRPWSDPDKRRALAISIILHLGLFLILMLFSVGPRPEPLPSYIVIDVGTPAYAEETTLAPTAEDPAPSTPTPQVASDSIGDPRELAAPQQESTAPQELPVTAQPPAPAAPPAEAAEAADSVPEPEAAAEVPAPPLPVPQVTEAAPTSEPLPRTELPATTLPEIDPVTLTPRPLSEPITLPTPQPSAQVSEARAVAAEPTAAVTEARELTAAQPTAAVVAAQPLDAPQLQATVSQATGLSAPNVQASVATATPLQPPTVEARLGSAVDLASTGVTATVSGRTPLAPPAVSAQVGSHRDVTVAPEAQVAQVRDVPIPSLRAEVLAPETAAGSPLDAGNRAGDTDVEATALSPRSPGGNAALPGQTGPDDPNAAVTGRGAAASPDGVGAGTGAPRQPLQPPFSERRKQALGVLIDNVGGYPQHGLREASMIIEMPVEGGSTRLMTIYDREDPVRVGPVRSARDYFVELARRSSAVLVHDGGSPGALMAIDRSKLPTLNAYSSGDLFARSGDRSAPYNLYSGGGELRRAMQRLVPDATHLVAGTIFSPSAEARQLTEVSVKYSGAYTSGFRYDAVLGSYRWIRDGSPANHPDGQLMMMEAVLVGEITAHPIPDDTAGRLYIPLEGGAATLYLKGRAETGRWELAEGNAGVRFRTATGTVVDLAPYRTWVMLTPTYDSRSEQ